MNQPTQPQACGYSIDADPQGIRARTADAIHGALASGFQGVKPPPEGHWLTMFWKIGKEAATPPIIPEAGDLEDDARQAHDQCRAVVYMAEALASVYRAHASLLEGGHMAHEIAGPRGAAAMEWLGDALNGMDAVADGDTWMADIFARAQARWPAARAITLTLEQARTLAEALDIGQDAAGAEAAQYHEAMAGYRPERHKAMDEDVAKVKAAGALLGQLIQGAEGGSEKAHG